VTGDRPLRVALDVSAVPERPVGAGQYVLALAEALSERPDVDLVVCSRRSDRVRWVPLTGSGDVVAAAPDPRPLRLLWERVRLGPLVGRTGAAVLHGPHYTMPRHPPVPAVVTIHDLSFFEWPRWHERSKVRLFRRAIRAAARDAQVVVCPSRITAESLHRWCRVDAEVVVAPHGVDADRFRPVEPVPGADASAIARLDDRLADRRPFLLFVGTLEPRKDVPSLVEAFRRVAGRHPDTLLVLAGGRGWGADAVDRSVTASGLAPRIVQTGYVADADVAALLRTASVAVYPSRYEGFGLPALEALACETPLVTTSGTAMEEVAGASALLFAPGDVSALADAIDLVLSGPGDAGAEERRALGREITRRHTWEASAAVHVEAYRSALCRRG
jgi:glycosyltransferase involved in cell wall biosynthesis